MPAVTDGHKHRMLRVNVHSRLVRWLRKPLRHSTNYPRVDRSPYPYRPCTDERCWTRYRHPRPDCWVLTPLSILHRWTGLTLEYNACSDPECTEDHG